ncbi:MAG: TolC family protein [Candidatus Gastranaerophilales bacterium]|nr:TolC family protein [Candidatus Gastranaerophilales bacterium]
MKRITIILLIVYFLGLNITPACAWKWQHDKKVIQSQVTEYKFKDVNLDWWQNYDDEYLEGYIVKAIDNNYDLKIATLKVEEARQNVKMQFSKELPSASIGAAPLLYKYTGVTNTQSNFGLPMTVNYELDLFLKNHDKTKSVKKLHEISKFNEKAAYISIASAVGATYFNIVKLDKLIDIQNEIINDRKKIFELMQQRNNIGITSTADETRAEKAYVMAVTDLKDLEKARFILLNSLAVLIGESPNNIGELKRISYDELAYKKQIPQEISSEIIMQRPDYLAAEKMVEKAGIDVRVARKEFLPKIDIMGLLFFSTSSLGTSMNWTNALAGILGQAMLPLFTGGAKFANLRLNKNKYEQVLQSYYKTNLVAIQEVNDSLSSLKLDDEKYRKNLKSYDMQKADYNYMKKRYEQGVISNLDLIQQKETLLVMSKMVTASKTDCYIDQISLYKAVGGKL